MFILSTGETIPPVPAPRYKRKLIANEDSRVLLNNQDICVNEKTVIIVPPPRRKNKDNSFVNINTISIVPSKQNSYSSVKETQTNYECITLANSFSNTSFITKEIIKANQKTDSELEEDQAKSCFHKLVNIEDCDIKHSISNSGFKISPNLGEPRECHIFDRRPTAENRVLGTSLENINTSRIDSSSQQKFDQYLETKEDGEKNRVKYNPSENSATIVGVFYKTDFGSKHGEFINKETLFSQPQSKELCSMHLLSSKVNYGNKNAGRVPLALGEYKKTNSKNMIKDSDENDSGVYFSDTKSPPHIDKVLQSTLTNDELKSNTDVDSDIEFYKAFPCRPNAGDTIDNNTSEDSGPQNYDMMLDYFEGQTVKSFRKQIASQLQLSNKEINKEKAVRNWLQMEEEEVEKRENSFSLYLKSMLENENSRETLSPYPLSTVDEDEKFDTISVEIKESKIKEDVYEKKSVPETCINPIRRLETLEDNNRIVVPSNDCVGDINHVNICPVNTHHNINFDKHSVNVIDCISKTEQNESNSLSEKLSIISDGFNTISSSNEQICNLLKVADEIPDSSYHWSYDSKLFTENSHLSSLNSAQPGNAVTSLIAFFENTAKEPFIPSYYDCFQSEEGAKNEDMHKSNQKDKVVQTAIELNSTKHVVKRSPIEQDVNNGVIISETNGFQCPDAVCKTGIPSIEECPTIIENNSLPEGDMFESNKIESNKKDEVVRGKMELNSLNFIKKNTAKLLLEGNSKEEESNNEVIISEAKGFDCPDPVCKTGIRSIEECPISNESESLSEPKVFYSGLELDSYDYNTEFTTVGSTYEKENNICFDETDDCLPLHTFSFQLPIESRHLYENQKHVANRKEFNFYERDQSKYTVDLKLSNTSNSNSNVNATLEKENKQDYVSKSKSFCKESLDFHMKSQKPESSGKFYSNSAMPTVKITKSECKLTRIPIVVLTDSDLVNSSPIGSVELYPSDDTLKCSTGKKGLYLINNTIFFPLLQNTHS